MFDDELERREKQDLLGWFENLATDCGYVFALRELYPKQKERLREWGFTVTTIGKSERNEVLELCGVCTLGAEPDTAAYYMLEKASERNKRLAYALKHPSSNENIVRHPYSMESDAWNQ